MADLFDDLGINHDGGGARKSPDLFDDLKISPPPAEGGFIASAKQSIGSAIKGAGQAAADFIPGVGQDNTVKRYGQEVIDANPTAVKSLGDIADNPGTAVKEAVGNAAGSMGGMLGARLLGQGITAAAPLTGPFAPVTAAVGQGVAWLGPAAVAALPSFGGIREQQIKDDPSKADDLGAKARAATGAAAVGAIESKFGPQEWALGALTKEGRAKLAEKFAAKTAAGSIGKGIAQGAAVEGAEELVQNPIEQVAAYQDPTTAENVQDTLFGGAMGAIGGGVMGGGFAGVSRAMGGKEQGAQPVEGAPEAEAAPLGLPAPTYTGTPSEQVLQAEAERQNQVAEAQARADALYRRRDEVDAARQPQEAGPDFSPVRDAYAAQLEALRQQEAGQPDVPQTAPPDGRAILDAQRAADRAVVGPDDEILQSIGAAEPPHRAMGIDPAAGPLSAGAAIAVDTGVHGQMQAAAQQAAQVEQPGAMPASEAGQPVTGYQVGQRWGKGNQRPYTIESVSPDGKLAVADFGRGKKVTVSFDAETANGWAPEGGNVPEQRQAATPAQRWASMSADERGAIAGQVGLPPVIARNIPRAGWESLNPDLQAKLAGALDAAPITPSKEEIDTAAHAAATSPKNDLAPPTEAQAKAGNYKKGHLSIGGLDIAIENPEGSTRSGIDPGGKPWSVTMSAHYGYVKRTQGADGDQVDVYIGKADPVASPVFVVDQFDNKTGKFDEHKAILGASSLDEARSLYDAHFSDGKGHERRGGITPMSFDAFKEWARSGNTKSPVTASAATTAGLGDRGLAAEEADTLRAMAQDAGWAERGGLLIRDTAGNATGRTKWLPRAEWFMAGMEADPETLARDIDRFVAGEKVPARSRRTIEGMLEWLDAQRTGQPLNEDSAAAEWERVGYNEASAEEQAAFDAIEAFIDSAPQLSERDALLALGFTEDEIRAEIEGTGSKGRAGEADAGAAQERAADDRQGPQDEAAGTFLEGYSEAELAARDEAQRLADESRAKAEKAADDKARADAERDTFALTGSDRPADVMAAQGQGGLFDAPAAQPAARNQDQGEFAAAGNGLGPAARRLRDMAAKSPSSDSDVGLNTVGGVKFIPFEVAVSEARRAIAAGVKPVPFQIHNALDILIGDAQRVIDAALASPTNQEPVKNEAPAAARVSRDSAPANQEPIKKAEPATPAERWDAMTAEQRGEVLMQPGGWSTASGGLNQIGKRLAGQRLEQMAPMTRATVERLMEKAPAQPAPAAADVSLADEGKTTQAPEAVAEQPAIGEAPSPLEALFSDLNSDSTRKANKARKAAAKLPQAERITYVQANFHDILLRLMEAGALEVNGTSTLNEDNKQCL